MQMWFDLVAAGVHKGKTDLQPNEILLTLWKQFPKDKYFQKFSRKRAANVACPYGWKILWEQWRRTLIYWNDGLLEGPSWGGPH
jgi:hypothetical protein